MNGNVPEVRISRLSFEAVQAIQSLRNDLEYLGADATEAEIDALINAELDKLPEVNQDEDKRRLFISELFSI